MAKSRNEIVKNWRDKNKAKMSEDRKRWHSDKKSAVIGHYGGKCELCGLADNEVMTVDHIWGDGAEHRKVVPASQIYSWLIKNDFPPGFRLLCFNCNHKAYQARKNSGSPPMSLYTIQREICNWASLNFPERNAESVSNKLMEELAEWAENPEDASEFADVMILLLDWAHLKGVDMQRAINLKMGVNVDRNWVFDAANRTWQHTENNHE
jgi:NTP pyrophosphatase (non-canonical NTP hydrolase)